MSDWLYNPTTEVRIHEEGMRVAAFEAVSWLTESQAMIVHWVFTLLKRPR